MTYVLPKLYKCFVFLCEPIDPVHFDCQGWCRNEILVAIPFTFVYDLSCRALPLDSYLVFLLTVFFPEPLMANTSR